MSIPQTESIGNRLQSSCLRLSKADTIKFLELYRNEMILYDSSVADYRNRHFRKEASKRIADAMNIPGFGARQVTKKFKNLRNAYEQEIKKIEDRKSYIMPSNVDSVYVPKVHWFSTMNSFLRPFIYRRFTATVSTNIYVKCNIFKYNTGLREMCVIVRTNKYFFRLMGVKPVAALTKRAPPRTN